MLKRMWRREVSSRTRLYENKFGMIAYMQMVGESLDPQLCGTGAAMYVCNKKTLYLLTYQSILD